MATLDTSQRATSTTVDPRGAGLDWGLTRIRKALKPHEATRCPKYAARERTWLATKHDEQDKDSRINQQRIRFAYQRIDVLMGYLTNDKPVARVAPLRPGASCEQAAKAAQRAQNIWRREDHRDEKEITLAQTSCIFGTAPYKSLWDYQRVKEKRRVVKRSLMGFGPVRFEETEDYVVRSDQPSMVPWDPYDFAWDPRANSEDTMRYAIFFDFPTKAELLAQQERGEVFNIDGLSANSERGAREFQRPGKPRDLEGTIEVAEIWDREENRQVSIANRTTVIQDRPSPYWHGQIPGGLCTTMPGLYSLDGASEVEVIAAIQAEMHTFRESWIFNAKMANKLLLIIDSSVNQKTMETFNNSLMVDDGKPVLVIPVEPGIEPPFQWSPAASLVPLGENVMAALTRDMDDMSGVNQYISGQSDQVDPKTATEVQQLANASQRRINAKKNQLGRGYERASVFDLKNMKQFMTTPLVVRLDGQVPDAAISKGLESDYSFDSIDPQDVVDADFELLMSNADETIDKQEERNQWMTLFTTLVAALPAFPPGSPMPNYAKLVERLLESYDVENPDEFMLEPPPMPPPLPVGPPPAPPGETPPGVGGASAGPSPLGPVPPPSFMQGGPGQAAPNPGAPA